MGEFSDMNNYMKYLKTLNSSQLYVTDMETNSLNHRELNFYTKTNHITVVRQIDLFNIVAVSFFIVLLLLL